MHPITIDGQTVRVSWDVDPPSALYRRNSFTLTFPASIDLQRVPGRLWGLIALLCLHPHWVLLRPCRVELPFPLAADEREVWYRLMDAAIVTLAAHAGRHDLERAIDIDAGAAATAWPPALPLPSSDRCSTSFSGGKDSLLQAGLLTELTRRPVLVATTSPLPGRDDHLTARRRFVFDTIQQRRDVTFVEVHSDFRAVVDYDFAHTSAGFATSVTELTDTFLFVSGQIAASAALGVTHLFQASEAEVQESMLLDGRIVQHRHFMYSAVTQRVISRLLAPHGMQLCSLTSPLYASQVHRLLWTRYRDVSDLQYSCWMVRQGEETCSRCRGCLEYAFAVLALGDRPARMGLDLGKVMREVRDWAPRPVDPANPAPTPSVVASQRAARHIMANVRDASTARFLWAMLRDHSAQVLSNDGREAVRSFRHLKRRLAPLAGAHPGYRPGFLALVDPLLREGVGQIYGQHFAAEPEAVYADVLSRSLTLSEWITAPVRKDARPA